MQQNNNNSNTINLNIDINDSVELENEYDQNDENDKGVTLIHQQSEIKVSDQISQIHINPQQQIQNQNNVIVQQRMNLEIMDSHDTHEELDDDYNKNDKLQCFESNEVSQTESEDSDDQYRRRITQTYEDCQQIVDHPEKTNSQNIQNIIQVSPIAQNIPPPPQKTTSNLTINSQQNQQQQQYNQQQSHQQQKQPQNIPQNQNQQQQSQQQQQQYFQGYQSVMDNIIDESEHDDEDEKFYLDQNTIGEIGKGRYGDVAQIIDIKDKNFPFYARKTFYNWESYQYEKQNYLEIEASTNDEIKNYLMMLTKFNDQGKYLDQKLGFCSLFEFTKMRKQQNIQWRIHELYYIFWRLVKFVYKFSSIQQRQMDFIFHQHCISEYLQLSGDHRDVTALQDKPNQLALLKLEQKLNYIQGFQNTSFNKIQGFRKNNDYEFSFLIKNFSSSISVGIYNDTEQKLQLKNIQNNNYNSILASDYTQQSYNTQKVLYELKEKQTLEMGKDKKLVKTSKYWNCYLISSNGHTYIHKQQLKQENYHFNKGDVITIKFSQKNRVISFYRNSSFLYEITNIEVLDSKEHYYPAVMLQSQNDQIQVQGKVISNAKYYHGDLKPSNVILTDSQKKDQILQKYMQYHNMYQNHGRFLELKIIDYGGASSSLTNNMFTPLYFNSFKRQSISNQEITFKSDEERFKGEIYSVLRTFMEICLHSVYQKFLNIQYYFPNFSVKKQDKPQILLNDTNESITIFGTIQNKDQHKLSDSQTEKKSITFYYRICQLKSQYLQIGLSHKEGDDYGSYLISANGDVNCYVEQTTSQSLIKFEKYDIVIFEINLEFSQFVFYNILNPNIKSNPIKILQPKNPNSNFYPCCILGPGDKIEFENGPILEKYFYGIVNKIKMDKQQKLNRNIDIYSEEENQYILDGLKTQVFSDYCEQDEQFSEFFDFLKTCILQERYSKDSLFEQLFQKFNLIKKDISQGIIDPIHESVIQKIIQQKVQTNNPLELVFQIKSYIPGTKCCKTEGNINEKFDLLDEANNFIQDYKNKPFQEQKQVFILVGDSGTGKSTFLNKIYHTYSTDLKKNQRDYQEVISLRFGSFSSLQQLEQKIENIYRNYFQHAQQLSGSNNNSSSRAQNNSYQNGYTFSQQQFQQRNSFQSASFIQQSNYSLSNTLASNYNHSESRVKIVFFLDGYDEITFGGENEEKLSQNSLIKVNWVKVFQLKKYTNVKLFISSRKECIPESCLNQIFLYENKDPKENLKVIHKKIIFFYICLFDKTQMKKFIDKYIESANDGAMNLYTNKLSFTKDQYLETFEKNKELEQMATNPLMLRIMLEVLPKIYYLLDQSYQNQQSQFRRQSSLNTYEELIVRKRQLNKKAFSKYNLYKEFTKNWIQIKVTFKLDHEQRDRISHSKQTTTFKIEEDKGILKYQSQELEQNIQKNIFQTIYRIYIFNSVLAMGLFLKNTQTFTKDSAQEIFQNNQKLLNIENDIELYLQCSPVKKIGEVYEYIHKSIFEYYVADNFITELTTLVLQQQNLNLAQIKVNVHNVGGRYVPSSQNNQNNNQNSPNIDTTTKIYNYNTNSNNQRSSSASQFQNANNNNTNNNGLIQHQHTYLQQQQPYYYYEEVQQGDIQLGKQVENMKLNKIKLQKSHIAIIGFMQNFYFQYQTVQTLQLLRTSVLLKIMEISKLFENKPRVQNISPNAATIFNALNFSFSGLDLSNTELSGALLQQAIMNKTNLQNANLQKTIFTDSILSDSNIINADITDADYGKKPDLKKQEKPILCVVYSPDGKLIASGNDDNYVTLYHIDNPYQFKKRERKHEKCVNSVCFSRDSGYLVSGSSDKSIIVWDTSLNILKWRKNAHKDSVTCVQFTQNKYLQSSNNKIIASASEDSQIIIWKFVRHTLDNTFSNQDSYNYELIAMNVLTEHQSCVTSIVFFEEGKKLASGSEDEMGIVYIWEQTKIKFQVKQKIKTGLSLVDQIAVSPDNRYIIAASSEEMQIWIEKQKKHGNQKLEWIKYRSLDSGGTCVAFSSDGKYVASGGRVIKLWSVESGELLQIMEGNSQVKAVTFSPFAKLENNYVVSGNQDNTIKVYSIRIGQQLKMLEGHQDDVVALTISKDETKVASGGKGGNIKIWDMHTGQLELKSNGFHTQGVSQMIFCDFPFGNSLLASVGGTVIYIWNINTGEKEATFFGHEENIKCIAYNFQYQQIATGSKDSTVKIWQLFNSFQQLQQDSTQKDKNSDPLITFEVPSVVNTVAYSHSGQFLATGSHDGIVRIYCVYAQYSYDDQYSEDSQEPYMQFNHENISQIHLHQGPVLSVTFLPDDRIVSAGCDKRIKIWNMQRYGFLDQEIEADMGDIKSILFLPNYHLLKDKKNKNKLYIAAGGTNSQIKIWDINQFRSSKKYQKEQPPKDPDNCEPEIIRNHVITIKGHSGTINALSTSSNGTYIACGGRSLKIWKIRKENTESLEYLIERNISKSQAFQCERLRFTDKYLNESFNKDEELSINKLNILLLRQYSQEQYI